MNRFWPTAIVVFLILGFVFVAQAIIGVKLLELRVKISRERILNYELSSQVLKEKFISLVRSEGQKFNKEVKQNILESAIMNDRDPEALKLNFSETIGYWVINAIRPLALKPFLHLLADQEELILMKYAFFMERNRRYDKAVEKYKQLLEVMPKDRSDARGFALLHTGYSLAVSGKTEKALVVLEQVRKEFSGSHYSQTAAILISLLREQKEAQAEIEKESLSNLEKARRYFKLSLYAKSKLLFQKEAGLLPMDSYRLARSQEETGEVKKAIKAYLKIVKADQDSLAVKMANRRLLLIGNFYGGGKKVKQFAEKKARALGDKQAVQEIKTAVKAKRKDVILEEIREAAQSPSEKKADPMLTQLGQELEENIILDEKITKPRLETLPKPIGPTENPARMQFRNPKIQVQIPDEADFVSDLRTLSSLPRSALLFPESRMEILLSDGRILQGRALIFRDAFTAEIEKEGFQSQMPLLLVKEIRIASKENLKEDSDVFMILFLKDRTKLSIKKLILTERAEVIYAQVELSNGKTKEIAASQIGKLRFP